MSRARTTIGKRNVQQQKREKAQAKQERKAARRAESPETGPEPTASEQELIDALAGLHGAVENGAISHEEFEQRREQIRVQLEQLERRDS